MTQINLGKIFLGVFKHRVSLLALFERLVLGRLALRLYFQLAHVVRRSVSSFYQFLLGLFDPKRPRSVAVTLNIDVRDVAWALRELAWLGTFLVHHVGAYLLQTYLRTRFLETGGHDMLFDLRENLALITFTSRGFPDFIVSI